MASKNYILDQSVANKKLRRMALEILERNAGEKHIIIAGIRGSGEVLACCIRDIILEISSLQVDLITIIMDKRQPKEIKLNKPIDGNGKVIIVTDDVSNSGRTLLYALKPFLEFQPKKIQTLVLVERTHTSFPVRPDYVGLSIATTLQEHIYVEVENEKVLGAYLQ